jgi:FAD/FMN-containing dehydrogenase
VLVAGFDGEIITDPVALDAAADDFGHIVRRLPRAVVRPTSVADVVAVINTGIPVVARGFGHATGGQAQVADGIVVDMTGLASVHDVADDRIVVAAGCTWRSVVAAAPGRTPPVLTDYLGVSVGGTLSAGGVGGTSHRYGVQTDNVLALDVVTGDGRVVNCSPGDDVFDAALAGYGQAGIITSATLRLVPAPAMVRRYVLVYPSAGARAADQRRLIADGRFAHVQGQTVAGENGWLHLLEAGAYHGPQGEPDDSALLADLAYVGSEITELSYPEFADRLAVGEAMLRQTGEWSHPHPWWNAFLPDSTVDDFMARLLARLTPAGLGASGLLLTYPIHTAPLRTPRFPVPDEPVVFLVALLRTGSPDDPVELANLLADNDYWYGEAVAAGGTVYPIGTLPAARRAP